MMRIPLIDKYSKEELEQIVAQSRSMNQVIDKIGYTTHNGNNCKTIKKRLEKYGINTSHFQHSHGIINRSDEQVFVKDSKVSQHCLRQRVLKKQLFPYICSLCGQAPFWNGEQLPLILDHINGQNHDNRINNIRWVCPNCNQQLPTTGRRKLVNIQNNVEKHCYCKKCGKEISHTSKSGFCMSCSKKNLYGNIDIDRDELKKLIRSISFLKIGKEYGVSDNAVRKWCQVLGLPYTKREINEYSDEQWAAV